MNADQKKKMKATENLCWYILIFRNKLHQTLRQMTPEATKLLNCCKIIIFGTMKNKTFILHVKCNIINNKI